MESQGIPYTKKAKFYNILSISEYSNIYKTFTFYSSEPAIADGIMEKIMNEGDDWMNWNETLRNNVTRAQELKTYMRLTSQEEEHMTRILEQFPMTVTRYYLSLIDWNNPEQDPVFRMSIPSIRETDL